jgi:hypothetical protein
VFDHVHLFREEVLCDVLKARWVVEVLVVLDRYLDVVFHVDSSQQLVVLLPLQLIQLEKVIFVHELLEHFFVIVIWWDQVEEDLCYFVLEWVKWLDLQHRDELSLSDCRSDSLYQSLLDVADVDVNLLLVRHKLLVHVLTEDKAADEIVQRFPGVVAVVESFPCEDKFILVLRSLIKIKENLLHLM